LCRFFSLIHLSRLFRRRPHARLCLCGGSSVTAGLLLAAEAPLDVVEGVVSVSRCSLFDRAARGFFTGASEHECVREMRSE
jgi:hypothetical protein